MASGPLAENDNQPRLAKCVLVKLDVTDEKRREWSGRYMPNALPTIVYLSSRGVIVSRTEGMVESPELGKTLDDLLAKAPAVDAELAKLEAARDKDPKSLAPVEALADFWSQRQNWFEAVAQLEILVRRKGDGALPEAKRLKRWTELARARASLGNFDDAVKECDSLAKAAAAAADDKDSVQTAYLLMGFCRENQGKLDEAIKAYEKCIEAAPDSALGKRADALKQKCIEQGH